MYAFDVARLPHWQQRVWNGHNITPEGAVSSELLDAQQRTKPAGTIAPEFEFERLLQEVNAAFLEHYGGLLFRSHGSTPVIIKRVHRFRALDTAGLLALAKDIARLTADSIDVSVLRTIVAPANGETWRSLRYLENALATRVDAAIARAALTPLARIYELRLADAHLPRSDIDNAYMLGGVSPQDASIDQAAALIGSAGISLKKILSILG